MPDFEVRVGVVYRGLLQAETREEAERKARAALWCEDTPIRAISDTPVGDLEVADIGIHVYSERTGPVPAPLLCQRCRKRWIVGEKDTCDACKGNNPRR